MTIEITKLAEALFAARLAEGATLDRLGLTIRRSSRTPGSERPAVPATILAGRRRSSCARLQVPRTSRRRRRNWRIMQLRRPTGAPRYTVPCVPVASRQSSIVFAVEVTHSPT